MSKKQEETGTELEVVDKSTGEIISLDTTSEIMLAIRNGGFADTRIFDALAQLPPENFVTISGEYLTMKPRTSYLLVALGMTTIPNKFKTEATPNAPERVDAVAFCMRIETPDRPIVKDKKTGRISGGEVRNYATCEAMLLDKVRTADGSGALPLVYNISTDDYIQAKSGVGKYLGMKIDVMFASMPGAE